MEQQAFEYQPLTVNADYSRIMIGNSCYMDDIWDVTPYMSDVAVKKGYKRIRFGVFTRDNYKKLMKQYAYYKLSIVKPRTVIGYVNGSLATFFNYCEEQCIYNMRKFTEDDLLSFIAFLRNREGFSDRSAYALTSNIEEVFRFGREKGWEVPEKNLFALMTPKDIWKRRHTSEAHKTQPIPEEIFDKILDCALNKEAFGITSAGIILQSQTGLRINEILSIREGCIGRMADGTAYMNVCIRKTERGDPMPHQILVNELVVDTVTKLEAYTKLLREESGLKELFLNKHQVIRNINVMEWTSRRLKAFIRRHKIYDKYGNDYALYSHQFRATFVKNLIKKNVPLAYIMKHYAHVSIEMTAHYLTLKNEEVTKMYTDMVLNKNSKLAGIRAKEIKEKVEQYFQGKMEAEIENAMSELAATLSYNPLPNGVCLYDFRRGNCTDGDGCFFYNCPNYVTEVKFYPILKKELEIMELEMNRFQELGRERDWQRQYVKKQYLKPLVEKLEEQINESNNTGSF